MGGAGRRLGGGLLGLVATLLLAELLVRAAAPRPRTQVVSAHTDALRIRVEDGVPLWTVSEPLSQPPCGDGPVVRLAGDSIFHTSSGEGEDRLAFQLFRRLATRWPGICVEDVSQPGYLPYQQLHEARRAQAERPADVVVMVVWKPPSVFTRIGDAWYDLAGYAVEDGLPRPPLPLPSGAHRALMTRSALWRLATLALGDPPPAGEKDEAALGAYGDAIAWAREAGVRLVFVEGTSFERPLDVTRDARRALVADPEAEAGTLGVRVRVQRAAEAAGVPYVVPVEAWEEVQRGALALDACCHLTDQGHAALAELVAPSVAEALVDEP